MNVTQIRPSYQPVLAAINRSVQNAYRWINRRSDGFLQESRVNKPTQSTGVQTLCVESTGIKEKCGAHLSYIPLARVLSFSVLPSRRRPTRSATRRRLPIAPPPFHLAAVCAPPQPPHLAPPHAAVRRPRRRSPTLPALHAVHRRRLAPAPLCAATAATSTATPRHRRVLSRRSHTQCHPRSHAIHTAAAAAPRSPGARSFAFSRWDARR